MSGFTSFIYSLPSLCLVKFSVVFLSDVVFQFLVMPSSLSAVIASCKVSGEAILKICFIPFVSF
uniref:Uncharacterized protein n=1 Tax=Arundo donax TaxID=35708 RepID=A0A0A9DXG9_ARUDO